MSLGALASHRPNRFDLIIAYARARTNCFNLPRRDKRLRIEPRSTEESDRADRSEYPSSERIFSPLRTNVRSRNHN